MASTAKSDRFDDLNESWVELHYGGNQQTSTDGTGTPPVSTTASRNLTPRVSCTGSLETLLIDAQRESRTPSRPNSNETSPGGSPEGPSSPNSEWSAEWRKSTDPGTDWIWDWSSRPDLPSSVDTWSGKFRHPGSKPYRATMSVRNTQVMKKAQLFSLANLPTLLFTHACTFFLGAAAVLFYFKKYHNLSSFAHAALD